MNKGNAPVFTKEQLCAAACFAPRRDILAAVLENGQSYTREQAERLIREFLNRKVK